MKDSRLDVVSINTLYEYAIPSKSEFKDHIGRIQYTTPDGNVYTTLIMTKTDPDFTIYRTVSRKQVRAVYNIQAGYIQVKPFLDKYL